MCVPSNIVLKIDFEILFTNIKIKNIRKICQGNWTEHISFA